MGLDKRKLTRETLNLVHANTKGADQPAHPRILISTFVSGLFINLLYAKVKYFNCSPTDWFEFYLVGNTQRQVFDLIVWACLARAW